MKIFLVVAAIFILVFVGSANSQSKKTIILVRHAEKDASATASPDDPNLSTAGLQRAQSLAKKIKRYRPGAVYSTNYLRTLDTAEPSAKRRNLKVQVYDAKKPNDLIDQIMKSKTKRFLIVGHSNTIPALANLLIKKELFKSLDDSEYGTIWVIRLRPGKEPRTEIFQY